MGRKEEIDTLDVKINKLKVDYEQYFAKILKKEPVAQRNEIDNIILRYSNQPVTNTSLKFRYSTIAAKYIVYKQFWNRMLRRIEDGSYEKGKGLGIISRATTANTDPVQKSDNVASPYEEVKKADLDKDSRFKLIYQQFIEEKKSCNDTSQYMPYEKFKQAISEQTEKIKMDMKCDDVEYKVVVKNGKTKITLIPIKKQ